MFQMSGPHRAVKLQWCLSACALLLCFAASTHSQDLPDSVVIPRAATALDGIPTVLISSDGDTTEKQSLSGAEATKNRLLITVVNGQFYWASRGNRPLQLLGSGAFTYLYEGPGAYIKFTKLGNKIVYMEHANISLSTLTYWGELKIITGK